MVTRAAIEEITRLMRSPEVTAEALFGLAMDAGGLDNITLAMIDVEPADGAPTRLRAKLRRVDLRGRFVAADRFDAREAQREAAGVALARLDGIEGDLEHDVRAHFAVAAALREGAWR